MTLHIHTPLIESRPLSQAAGCAVWLKLDALQPCGSFKLRGVGHACEVHHARGARHFVSSSGGNAGLAVAYAGRKLGVPVTVVVPETTTARAKELLHQEDAKVVVHGSSWQEANALAQTLVGPDDAFIHPFDDPLLWAGHASLVDEVAATGYKPDAERQALCDVLNRHSDNLSVAARVLGVSRPTFYRLLHKHQIR